MTAPLVPVQPIKITAQSIEESLMQIPSLLEVGANENDHVILFGEPKSGKTTLAALLSEFYNILWFDGDKGLIAALQNCHPEMAKRIRPIKIMDNTDFPSMVLTMLRVITGRPVKVCITHGFNDCNICMQEKKPIIDVELNKLPKNWVVVMDSQTQFYASVLAFAYYKDTGKAIGSGVPHDYKGDWDYRGIAYNCVDKFGNYLKDLPCKFISISHETVAEMKDEVTTKVVPVAGSKNLSAQYGKWFGTMIYAKKANNKHNFMSSSLYSGMVQTGSRTGVSLEKKEVPSLVHIFNPKEADELLKNSYNHWWLTEGYKDIKDRTKGKESPPQPKGIIQV